MVRMTMRDGSGSVTLKHLIEDRDRHGNVRLYVRVKGRAKVRLRSQPGTDAFLSEYRAAVAGDLVTAPRRRHAPASEGSFRWLCERYYASPNFLALEPRTRKVRRLILDPISIRHGDKPFRLMEARHVRAWRDGKADRPEAANAIVKALRQVFAFAMEYDLAKANPARDVSYIATSGEGFHTWTLDEVERFESRWPIGSPARLAMALMLYTGQRRSDVVRLGRQHMRAGWLRFTQAKNQRRRPVTVEIPILAELQAIIDATPSDQLTFIVTEFGRPFTANGFGNRFRKWCDEAGLPQCSAHGLRKAAAARLAERGATENEIMSVTGHTTSKEVVRYTRGARQKLLAANAMARMGSTEPAQNVPPGRANPESGTISPANPLKKKEA